MNLSVPDKHAYSFALFTVSRPLPNPNPSKINVHTDMSLCQDPKVLEALQALQALQASSTQRHVIEHTGYRLYAHIN